MFHGVDNPQAMRDGNQWVNTWASLPSEEVSMMRWVLSRFPEESELEDPRLLPAGTQSERALSSPPGLTPSPTSLGPPPKSTTCPKSVSHLLVEVPTLRRGGNGRGVESWWWVLHRVRGREGPRGRRHTFLRSEGSQTQPRLEWACSWSPH